MFSLIIDLKNNIEAVIAIGVALATLWRFIIRPAWRFGQRMERAIGSNGGTSLFEQFEHLKDMLHIHASLEHAIDRPSLFISANGEVESVNVAFTERTGLSKDSLSWGGWRQLFTRDDQNDWDEVVARKSVFRREVILASAKFFLVANPVFNGDKFLGWRAVLKTRDQMRRKGADLPS